MPSETRTIFCPACGRRLRIPGATAEGRKARCGACDTVFAVPAPVENTRSHDRRRPTEVGQFRIQDLPTDLQSMIGPDEETTDLPDPPDPATEQRVVSPAEARKATRRAFDLDTQLTPARRTGAGVIKLSDLGITPEDDKGGRKTRT